MKMRRELYAAEESSKLTTNKGLRILVNTIVSHLVALFSVAVSQADKSATRVSCNGAPRNNCRFL